MKFEFPRQIFEKYLYWISRKSLLWEKCCSVQTGGRTNVYDEANIRSSQCLRTRLKVTKISENAWSTVTCFSCLCPIVCNNTYTCVFSRSKSRNLQPKLCMCFFGLPGHMPSTLQLPRFYFPNPFRISSTKFVGM